MILHKVAETKIFRAKFEPKKKKKKNLLENTNWHHHSSKYAAESSNWFQSLGKKIFFFSTLLRISEYDVFYLERCLILYFMTANPYFKCYFAIMTFISIILYGIYTE